MKRRLQQIDESIERYLGQLASADRQESTEDKTQRLDAKIAKLKQSIDTVFHCKLFFKV